MCCWLRKNIDLKEKRLRNALWLKTTKNTPKQNAKQKETYKKKPQRQQPKNPNQTKNNTPTKKKQPIKKKNGPS